MSVRADIGHGGLEFRNHRRDASSSPAYLAPTASIRVLSVIHGPVFGGPHNQAAELYADLSAGGVETTVVLSTEASIAAARLRSSGIAVEFLPLVRPRASDLGALLRFLTAFYRNVEAIRRLIKNQKPDVVQVHGLLTPQAAIAARCENVSVVWQLIDTRPPIYLRWLLAPLVLFLADVVMTTGARVAQVYPGVASLRARLVPFCPPVDPSRFRPSSSARAHARIALNLDRDAIVVGAVGNRNPQKGYEYLIRAFAHLRMSYPSIQLRIFGHEMPGHERYERKLQRELAMAGVPKASVLSIPDDLSVADVMNGLDILVLPSVSRSEGIPTVVLEAMACGLPVVATDVGSVREVLRQDTSGLIIPSCDVLALVKAIAGLVDDRNRCREIGIAARQATELWSSKECAVTHIRAYKAAIAYRMNRAHA